MKHLSTEEIIKYVTVNKVDKESLDLLSKVNGHIRNCPSCKEKVDSFERVNDELKKYLIENEVDLEALDEMVKEKEISINEYY